MINMKILQEIDKWSKIVQDDPEPKTADCQHLWDLERRFTDYLEANGPAFTNNPDGSISFYELSGATYKVTTYKNLNS
jgi:hypothetical protein